MNYHPHIHVIVLGGGLDSKNGWRDNGSKFFLPIRVLSKKFRGKYMEELNLHHHRFYPKEFVKNIYRITC